MENIKISEFMLALYRVTKNTKRLIDIVVPGAKTMEALFKIDLPAGVEFDVIQK